MGTISKTIASSGGDYTSLSLAEASIPGSGTDDYVFTYIEALSDTTRVVCSFGGTNTMTVDVQEAYRAEGAESGSHAELVYDGATNLPAIDFAAGVATIRNLRIVRTGAAGNLDGLMAHLGASPATLDRCTLVLRGTGDVAVFYESPSDVAGILTVTGCFIIVSGLTATHPLLLYANSRSLFYRNTVFVASGTITHIVRAAGGATCDARENKVLAAAGATVTNCYTADLGGSFTGGSTHNVSSDTTAPGSSPMTNETAADLLTTLTVGSEDLHYPSRAAMLTLTAGADLSATTGTVDIDGDTIAAWYPGADYVVAPAAAATPNTGGLRLGLRLGL